ncbi:mediator of RNA polymerase II transcription subunit 10b-like isoform X1 [Nymphaea colorata]|uniref:mediator of RNA polymerase II transcription subunit 10b-like isoform X1 n=2 Tax=Nymphaea colorata TaxID=210225 RepID=UPI00214F471F|nr:mediator of RNA polymerase II transcription subunit 10b-like isoform X1 [Nymphaea colorata]
MTYNTLTLSLSEKKLASSLGKTMATPTGNGSTPTSTPAQTPSEPDQQQKQNLSKVLNSIQQSLGLLHQLHLTVSSFNMASQLPLLQRLNDVVLELEMLQKLADSCNIQVPMEVVNLIDDGKNPDEFTRDVINSCIARNQVTKGKTDAFKSLRKHLLEELEQAFPEEVEVYREIRATSAAESKRLAQAQSILPNGDMKINSEH